MRAMILAAGRGERMRPLTDHCPKPLLKAGGKPLLQWHIEGLVGVGVREIVINHAHLGHQIESYFGDGKNLGARLQYLHFACGNLCSGWPEHLKFVRRKYSQCHQSEAREIQPEWCKWLLSDFRLF